MLKYRVPRLRPCTDQETDKVKARVPVRFIQRIQPVEKSGPSSLWSKWKVLVSVGRCHFTWPRPLPSSLGVTCVSGRSIFSPSLLGTRGANAQALKTSVLLGRWLFLGFPQSSLDVLDFQRVSPSVLPWVSLCSLEAVMLWWDLVGWNLMCPTEKALESHRLVLSQGEVFGLGFHL